MRKKGVPSLFQLKMGGGFFPFLSKAYTQDKQSESIFFFGRRELVSRRDSEKDRGKKEKRRTKREGGERERERQTRVFFFYIWEFRAKMNREACRHRRIGRVSGLSFSGNIFRGSSMFFLKKSIFRLFHHSV